MQKQYPGATFCFRMASPTPKNRQNPTPQSVKNDFCKNVVFAIPPMQKMYPGAIFCFRMAYPTPKNLLNSIPQSLKNGLYKCCFCNTFHANNVSGSNILLPDGLPNTKKSTKCNPTILKKTISVKMLFLRYPPCNNCIREQHFASRWPPKHQKNDQIQPHNL